MALLTSTAVGCTARRARRLGGSRSSALAIAVGLIVVASPQLADGFNCTAAGDRCYVNIRWFDRTVPYTVRIGPSSRLAAAFVQGAAGRAFDRYNDIECADLRFVFAGVVRADEPLDGANEVTGVASGWVDAGRDPNAAALTLVSFGVESGRIVQARVEVNEQFHQFVDADADPCTDAFDLEAVLTHEAGHMAGLSHPCEFPGVIASACPIVDCNALLATLAPGAPLPTMWPVVPACDVALRTLEADDIAGICTLYPTQEPSRACFPLPDQVESYVSNEAFGCRVANNQGARVPKSMPWGAILVLLCGLKGLLRGGVRATNRSNDRCASPKSGRAGENRYRG